MRESSIDVVVPTYNSSITISRAINSIIRQTFPISTIWIVDNHSDDDTVGIVKRLNKIDIKVLKIRNDGIIAKSRNLGIERSSSDYIAFLDSDDEWDKDHIQSSLELLTAGADITYGKVRHVNNKTGGHRYADVRSIEHDALSQLLEGGNCICTSSVVARTKVLQDVGGFPEQKEFAGWEDFGLWINMATSGKKFAKTNVAVSYYSDDSSYSATKAFQIHRNVRRFLFDRYCADELPAWHYYSVGLVLQSRKRVLMSRRWFRQSFARSISDRQYRRALKSLVRMWS